jgi:two-component system cell cycle response regulator
MQPFEEKPGTPFRSLATSLVRRTIGVAIACTVLVAGIQALFMVSDERKSFERDLQSIASANVPLMSVSLWDIEPEAIRRQLERIAKQPEIAHVRVEARTGHAFEAGRAALRNTATARVVPVPFPEGREGVLGTLEFTPNPAALSQRLAAKILGMVAGHPVLALAVCALIVAVLRAELERPMRLLAKFTTELTPNRLTVPLEPLHSPRKWQDEIDLVANGFRTLQDGIHSHVANLDAQVAIRTAQLEAALEENRALTITDALTGCYNRRYLDTRLVEEVLRSHRSGHALCVMMADIDHFKHVNDKLGHAAGDVVLRGLADIFRQAMRERIDWVARFGGEEFVIVLPDTGVAAGKLIAERMRASIEAARFEYKGQEIAVTVSFGVAQREEDDDAAHLLARADTQLYQAKGAGRNRVEAFESALDAPAG